MNNIEQRFWSKVNVAEGCWNWTGSLNSKGYGSIYIRPGKRIGAHRLMARLAKFSIPKGLVSDHLCRNRRCVNPEHIEFVTNRENVLRGIGPTAINAKKTHCPSGHEYNEKNTKVLRGYRRCLPCHRAHSLRYFDKNLRVGPIPAQEKKSQEKPQ